MSNRYFVCGMVGSGPFVDDTDGTLTSMEVPHVR